MIQSLSMIMIMIQSILLIQLLKNRLKVENLNIFFFPAKRNIFLNSYYKLII